MKSRHWNTVKGQERPLKFVIARILMRMKLSKLFLIRRKKYSLRFYPTSLSMALWIDPNYQHAADIFFEDYLQQGDIVIDIGANIGTVALEASTSVGDTGKVFAIEAHPQMFEFLQGNIKLNRIRNIVTYNIALGNKKDTVVFSNIRSDDQNSVILNDAGIKVPLSRLDDLNIGEEKIDLLKIDVLGYEKFVLEGANKILSITSCVHFPLIEKDFEKYDYGYKDIFEIFQKFGFELFKIPIEGRVSRFRDENLEKNNLVTDIDLLAIRNIDDFLKRTGYDLVD